MILKPYLSLLVVAQKFNLIVIDVGFAHSKLSTVELLSATQGFEFIPVQFTRNAVIWCGNFLKMGREQLWRKRVYCSISITI